MNTTTRQTIIAAFGALSMALTGFAQPVAISGAPSQWPTPAQLETLRQQQPAFLAQAAAWLMSNRRKLGLDERSTFRDEYQFLDPSGVYHARFRQLLDGVPVHSSTVIMHVDSKGKVLDPTAKLFTAIPVGTKPVVTGEQAKQIAASAFGPAGARLGPRDYTVELAIEPNLVYTDRGPNPGKPDSAYRRYDYVARSFNLIWQVRIAPNEFEAEPMTYHIDAMSGVVRSRDDGTVQETATGNSFFNGVVKFDNVKSFGQFVPWDPTRGGSGIVNDRHEGIIRYTKGYPIVDDDNTWGNFTLAGTKDATDGELGRTAVADAFYAIQSSWDTLWNVFGRWGYNGLGAGVLCRVHWGDDYKDAQWEHQPLLPNYSGMYLGDGGSSTEFTTVAHELGHGVWFSVFGYTTSQTMENRGLNEGQADVFRAIAEFHTFRPDKNGSPLNRAANDWHWHARMVDPSGYSAKDQLGWRFWKGNPESAEEHVIGCLLGHIFVMLSDGVRQHDGISTLSSLYMPHGMQGIGTETAAWIWYLALAAYFPENGDFHDFRSAMLQAAKHLNGDTERFQNSIRAAFRAADYGDFPEVKDDKKAPTVGSVTVRKVDPENGYMAFRATASDDFLLGRVDFLLNGKVAASAYSSPFEATIDLTGVSPDDHEVKVIAYDANGNASAPKSVQVKVKPVFQAIRNSGFELGPTTHWTVNSGAQITKEQEKPFAGEWYLRMQGGGVARQDFSVPASAQNARISYRVRAENHVVSGMLNIRFAAQLYKDDILVQTLEDIGEQTLTADDPYGNGYKASSFPLNYTGDNLRIRFVSTGSGNHRFKVDNVRVTYEQPVGGYLQATVQKSEETLEVRIKDLTGIPGIKHVRYTLDGQPFATASSGPEYAALRSTETYAPKTYDLVAEVVTMDDTIARKMGTKVTLSKSTDLLKNGGFEQNFSFWGQENSVIVTDDPDKTYSFMGVKAAALGGSGAKTSRIWQTVSIPKTAKSAKVTFRVRVESTKPNNQPESMFVRLRDPHTQFVVASKAIGDPKLLEGSTAYRKYEMISFDIPAEHLGTTRTIEIAGQTSAGAGTTWMYIDQVTVTWEALGLQL